MNLIILILMLIILGINSVILMLSINRLGEVITGANKTNKIEILTASKKILEEIQEVKKLITTEVEAKKNVKEITTQDIIDEWINGTGGNN